MSKEIIQLSDRIKIQLEKGLPGEAAQNKMIPKVRRSLQNISRDRDAAVLILLFPDNGKIKISLIQRTKYEGEHSGQVSLPGGMKEDKDHDLLQTAIRETSEETGIPENELKVIGKLTPLYIPVSAFMVHPFIGYMEETPIFSPDPVEVEFMINIPVIHLLKNKNKKKENWNLSGTDCEVPFYLFENYRIWGATAMILSEFIDLVAEIEPDQRILQYSDNGCNDT